MSNADGNSHTPIELAEGSSDPNMGREWDSIWGRQKIVKVTQGKSWAGIEDMYTARNYYAGRLEEVISRQEYELTPAYAKEQEERKRKLVAKQEAEQREAKRESQINAEIDKFASSLGLSPMATARVKNALLLQVMVKGEMTTRKEWMEKALREGYTVGRTKYGRVLMAPDGESFFTEKTVTKTGLDYAEFIFGEMRSLQHAGERDGTGVDNVDGGNDINLPEEGAEDIAPC